MSYKTQHTILIFFILAFIVEMSLYPFSWPEDKMELVAELSMLSVSLAVMYYIKPLKAFPRVYWLMLFGSAFYSVSAFMDVSEEFFVGDTVGVTNMDDFLQTIGFVLLTIGIYRWMSLHKALIRELKIKAETDQLTGLLNRRAFIQKLTDKHLCEAGIERALLLLDVDHFKAINDSYGHACGDIVLVEVATKLQSLIRADDILARWGGEEFLFCLANTTQEQAVEIAHSLRQHIEQLKCECNDKTIQCTVSIGVYQTAISECLEQEVDYADQALYQAKAAGRNCVMVYNKPQ